MNKRNWKIVYAKYEGLEKKSVELLYREMGKFLLRDKGVYTIHTLLCEQETETTMLDKNAVVVALFDESSIIRNYINSEEIKEDGYCIKVTEGTKGNKIILITANTPEALFYGTVDFIDDYFAVATPSHGSVKLVHELFSHPMPNYTVSSAPAFKTRSVFTWGHPINDYRNYIENTARLKFNQLIVWNDYLPLNAKDIVDYAHSYGIELIWGYAWGWTRKCDRIKLDELDKIKEDILYKYEKFYRLSGADGIYFQSFTETEDEYIDGELIAEKVTDFVNSISAKMLSDNPNLKLQFGLHATSVNKHLDLISRIDNRIEIMWEDCGSFPFAYEPTDIEKFEETTDFTNKLLDLRKEGSTALLYKGCMILDWTGDRFVHQSGPYVMGNSSSDIIKHDKELLSPIWRNYQNGWLQNGHLAHKLANHILVNSKKPITLGVAGQFAGEIWFPQALCGQILWDADKPYSEVLDKVLKRGSVEMV